MRSHAHPDHVFQTHPDPDVQAVADDPEFFAECIKRIRAMDVSKLPQGAYADVLETMDVLRRYVVAKADELGRREKSLAIREDTVAARENAAELRFRAVRIRENMTPEPAPRKRGWF